jgi:hypothetical protein
MDNMKQRMWSLAIGLVCAGMALSVSGHAGASPQKPESVAAMSALDLPALQKPITKRFVNAKLDDVLAWLSLEQLSFVADSSEFPNKTVTLSFRGQRLGSVLDAIAEAFGGSWQRRGEIFTLRPAIAFRPATLAPSLGLMHDPRTRVAAPTVLAKPDGKPTFSVSPLAPRSFSGKSAFEYAQQPAPKVSVTTKAAPAIKSRIATAPAVLQPRLLNAGQGSQEEAMRAAERALRAAEEALRKLHESGELRRAMEEAMSGSNLSEEMRRALEEVQKALRNLPKSEEWQKVWQQAREEMRAALRSGRVREGGTERAMTPEEREKLAKTLERFETREFPAPRAMSPEFQKELHEKMKLFEKNKGFGPEFSKDLHEKMKLHEKKALSPEFQKDLHEKMKLFEKNKGFGPEFSKDLLEKMKLFERTDAFGPDDRERKIQERIRAMRERAGVKDGRLAPPRALAPPRGFVFDQTVRPPTVIARARPIRAIELIESLSAEQKAKQEKQGYLTPDDLTPKQRELLGELPKGGDWTFSFTANGRKLTIKSK